MLALIPVVAILPILLYIGMLIGSQAFQERRAAMRRRSCWRCCRVRVEFGQRVTWNVARHELGLSANQPSMALRLPAPLVPTPTVARSLP
jgi:hypothetical protein